jgi:16S rRNA (guanine527-N7)-methyltransferase
VDDSHDRAIRAQLYRAVTAAGQPPTPEVIERLAVYVQELHRWSRRMSLTTLDPAGIVARLVRPSLALAALPVYRASSAVADLGSGGGVPGVPLQIIAPRPRLVLIEARHKRATFLRHTVRACRLSGVEVITGRAEAVVWPRERRVDLVVCRAVAPAPTVLPWCMGLVRVGGTVVITGGVEAAPPANLPAGWEGPAVATRGVGAPHLYRRCST